MRFYKLWLILFSVGLIIIDKYSFISSIRDSITIFMEKHTTLTLYRIQNYPRLVMLKVTKQQELASQNARLKKQVEEYALLLKQSKNQAQNLSAVAKLNPQGVYNNFNQIVAKAILDVNFFVNNQLLINVGLDHKVGVGNAVVNSSGVVGQVSVVNANSAQVEMITNPNFKIYVEESKNKFKMLAEGIGNNNLSVRYIDKSDPIKPGDILETTGLDNTFPANIPVTRVVKVFYENNGFNSALCEPVVDFHQLQYVLVLK